MNKKLIAIGIIVLAAIAAGVYAYYEYEQEQELLHPTFYCGNGRLEATEINIAAKASGRIEMILAEEGDYVQKNDVLAKMQTNVLEAELQQAEAKKLLAVANQKVAMSEIHGKEGQLAAAQAAVEQAQSKFKGADQTYKRKKTQLNDNTISRQEFENAETAYLAAKAVLAEAQASVSKCQAGVESAKANYESASAQIKAATADANRIRENIKDCFLKAPRGGRIQYHISEEGEILSAGGRVLNMVDLLDVYMTFFLPENVAGQIEIGSEVFIVLDAMPEYPVPAVVTFVDAVAQFTPKSVETKIERQKLMFRVKAHVSPELLKMNLDTIKTGIPGVAWLKVDPKADWADSPIGGLLKEEAELLKKQNIDPATFFKQPADKKEKRNKENAAKAKALATAFDYIKVESEKNVDQLIKDKTPAPKKAPETPAKGSTK